MTILYQRTDPTLGATIAFRPLDIETDLERFNRWHNNERVATFWDQRGTPSEHRAYLEKLIEGGNSLPVIGSLDAEPFLYLEIYWAARDPIANHYDAEAYDRGIHMLVGEEHQRGPRTVHAWLTALCDYLFADCAQTRRIVSEPRHDNSRMIHCLQREGFAKLREFDFPHKRAALMMLARDAFTAGGSYEQSDL